MNNRYNEKIEKLLSSMTIDEKIGQTNMLGGSIYTELDTSQIDGMLRDGLVGSIMYMCPQTNNKLQRKNLQLSKSKIPILFCGDIIHGVRTIFPIPLAESCSWLPQLAYETSKAAALEGTALGCKWTFAPMADIVCDARWGRVMESSGEDKLLASDFVAARVKGFQGTDRNNIDSTHMASCIKHFTGYGSSEGGRDYNSVTLSKQQLDNRILPPYKSGIDAGAVTVMTAFNDINGTPCTVNNILLDETLRKSWGFDGVIVSDYNSLKEAVIHKYCSDDVDAVISGINATLDIDMMSKLYITHIKQLIDNGKLSINQLDDIVRRILLLKYRVEIMDNPYTDETLQNTNIATPQTLELAYESCVNSIVLLKNDNRTLPIVNKKIYLTGPFTDDKRNLNGNWSYYNNVEQNITVKQALSTRNAELVSNINDCDVIIYCGGHTNEQCGEAASMVNIELPHIQQQEIIELSKYNKPIVLVINAGRPLALASIADYCSGILFTWHLGTRAGDGIADILIGNYCPRGKLTMSFPHYSGQCPIYYSEITTGRPANADKYTSKYIDSPIGPMYPFGYGLSYTKIEYSNITLKTNSITAKDNIYISVTVKNSGKYATREIIQAYCSKQFNKPIRPKKELIGYESVELQIGESKTITMEIPACNLMYKHQDNSGKYDIYVGKDSNCGIIGTITFSN